MARPSSPRSYQWARSRPELRRLRAERIEEICALADEGWDVQQIARYIGGVTGQTIRNWIEGYAPELLRHTTSQRRKRHRDRERFWRILQKRFPPDEEGAEAISELMRWRANTKHPPTIEDRTTEVEPEPLPLIAA